MLLSYDNTQSALSAPSNAFAFGSQVKHVVPMLKLDFNIKKNFTPTPTVVAKTHNGRILGNRQDDTLFFIFRFVSEIQGAIKMTAIDTMGNVTDVDVPKFLDKLLEGQDIDIQVKCDLPDDARDSLEEGARSMSLYIPFDAITASESLREYNGEEYIQLHTAATKVEFSMSSLPSGVKLSAQLIGEAIVAAAPEVNANPLATIARTSKRQAKKAVKRVESQALRAAAPQPEVKEEVVTTASKQSAATGSALAADFQAGKSFAPVSTSTSENPEFDMSMLDDMPTENEEALVVPSAKAPVERQEPKAEVVEEVSNDTDSAATVRAKLAAANNMVDFFTDAEEPTEEQELKVRKAHLEDKAMGEGLTDDENREYQAILKLQGESLDQQVAKIQAAGGDSMSLLW